MMRHFVLKAMPILAPYLMQTSTGFAQSRLKTLFCWDILTARPLKIIFLWVTHCKPLILLNLGVTLTLLIGFVFEEQVMYEKGGNVAWLWFQGLLKLGWVHMFFNPPCSTQNPSLLTCEWDLAKSGRRLCGLWHSAAQRNVWLSHTAALHVYICDHRGEVQRVTWTEKVFPGTALENNNVYDSQESTRRLENTWAGEALRGCPGLPLPRTHFRNTSPRAGAAPTPSAQGGGLFWANHGKKGRAETGSWEFYVGVPLWSQRLWHLLVKCTDILAEGHGWALWPDTMQMWATLFVQLSHSQQRDKAVHQREYRCPGPLCMPRFLERPISSHNPTGAHCTHPALSQSQGESMGRVLSSWYLHNQVQTGKDKISPTNKSVQARPAYETRVCWTHPNRRTKRD